MYSSPILYKKSSEGKIEEWEIKVNDTLPDYAVTNVIFGEQGGNKITKPSAHTIGKNIGKRNETSPYQQAVLEAQSKYTKKLKEGYVTSLEAALSGEVDELIEGGISPMLAHGYEDNKHKISFPVYVQPKLNGHRCIALKKDGKVELWSRKRHKIVTVPHLVQQATELLEGYPDGTFLDGELYKHGWTLQKISGAGKKLKPESAELEYHLYDMGDINRSMNFVERNSILTLMEFTMPHERRTHLSFLTTYHCNSELSLKALHTAFLAEKFEGAMIRALDTEYELGKRSYSLLKLKLMQDAEFPIEGVRAGKDGTVIFRVRVQKDMQCDVTMSGPKADNQKYLNDQSLWLNKQLTVQFQSYTPDGSLEFPIGLQIREDL